MSSRQELLHRSTKEPLFQAGNVYKFPLLPYNRSVVGGNLEDVRGGGFYGSVYLFPDFVIKSTQPDGLREFFRLLNWTGRPFPSQSIEVAARLDHVATDIFHTLIPSVTDNTIVTPASYGYTHLGILGFAQILERMQGRGPIFTASDENDRVRQVRQLLWDIGVEAGFEHVAQVHPRNPFGKPNLWLPTTDDGRVIWIDTLPAMRHSMGLLFPFHSEIRAQIGGGALTFNKIHTERMRTFLAEHDSQIPSSAQAELFEHLSLYDRLWSQYQEQAINDTKTQILADALSRGIITPEEKEILEDSPLRFTLFAYLRLAQPAMRAVSEYLTKTKFYRFFTDPQFRQDVSRLLTDADFRTRKIHEGYTLNGIIQAHYLGIVSDKQLQEAWETVMSSSSPKKIRDLASSYVFLQLWYIVSSQFINAISLPLYASAPFAPSPLARLGLALFVDWVIPPVLRATATAIVATLRDQDLRTARFISSWPKVGGYLAISADIARQFGERSEQIWHYTKRGLIAGLSKALPWGGWNSDLEERLWHLLRADRW